MSNRSPAVDPVLRTSQLISRRNTNIAKGKQQRIGFYLTQKGVFHRRAGEQLEYVAPRIDVKAAVSVAGSTAKFVVLDFDDYDGKVVELKLARADYLQYSRFRHELGNAGYNFPQDDSLARRMHEFLKQQEPFERWEIVDRIGWHGNEFVLPNSPANTTDGTLLRFEPANPEHYARYGCKGTLEGWNKGVASLAVYSSRLTLALCCAFAAPMLRFVEVEGGGFHLSGESSKGKTTCVLAATSVSGPALRHELFTWNTSNAGLSELAAAHNDCLLCLDEVAQIQSDARGTALKLRQSAFMLAGGRGRILSSVWGVKLGMRDLKWKLLILSTGEKAMFELASEADVRRLKGEEVRLIDVPAISTDQLGIYERLAPGFSTPASLSDAIVAACAANYGVALDALIQKLKENADNMPDSIRAEMQAFMKGAQVPGDGWERRFAQRFALAFAAGAIAAKFGIVPWSRAMVGQNIRACYQAACRRVPDADRLRVSGLALLRTKLSSGAYILDLVRVGHKVQWSPEDVETADAFRRSGPGGVHYLIRSESFVGWFESPMQANLVLDELDRLGLLIKQQPNVRTVQVAIHGVNGRRRYYAVQDEVLSPG
jgi:putative DNA primase/helicase